MGICYCYFYCYCHCCCGGGGGCCCGGGCRCWDILWVILLLLWFFMVTWVYFNFSKLIWRCRFRADYITSLLKRDDIEPCQEVFQSWGSVFDGWRLECTIFLSARKRRSNCAVLPNRIDSFLDLISTHVSLTGSSVICLTRTAPTSVEKNASNHKREEAAKLIKSTPDLSMRVVSSAPSSPRRLFCQAFNGSAHWCQEQK